MLYIQLIKMPKTFYTLANFFVDDRNDHPWMTSTPFYQMEGDRTHLAMIRDTFINFVALPGETIRFSLYRIEVDDAKSFLQKRAMIFNNKDYTFSTVRSYGFEKVVDFNYIVDEEHKEQDFNGIKIRFCYDRDEKMFKDKIYLSCPSIDF